MPFPRTAPFALSLLLLAACSDVQHLEVRPEPALQVHSEPRNAVLRHDRALGAVLAYVEAAEAQKAKDRAAVLLTALVIETVKSHRGDGVRSSVARNGVTRSQSPVQPGGSVSSVMDCIKAHESGNYTEQSHPGSGSGAYQYVPQTWRTWSARAGYPGYAYAFQAPASVQDAVTAFTLTHGGAGNWSTRYGADPCTEGGR